MEVKMSEYVKHILGIEKIKKEADALMMNKISKYEKEIANLKKEICELRQDNRQLAHQVEEKDKLDEMRKAGM
jgi:prefoldin subunit 5